MPPGRHAAGGGEAPASTVTARARSDSFTTWGLTARPHGAKEKKEGKKATLTVPLDSSLESSEPLVWHLTWRRSPG